jgi:hypothetical protein
MRQVVEVQARRTRRPLPFALMVTSPTVVFMVVVPVASLLAALMVVAPIIARPAAIVSCVMPFPFAPVVFFPLPTLPITTPVIVPVTIPARTNDNSGRRLDIHLWGWSVDRLGRIDSTGDSNVYSNIDVCEGDGRYAYAKAGYQCRCESAAA